MRCKPGDLCLVLGRYNIGRVVTTIQVVHKEEVCKLLMVPPHLYDDQTEIFWEVDQNLIWGFYEGIYDAINPEFVSIPYCLDHFLLPINGIPDENQKIEENQLLTLSA